MKRLTIDELACEIRKAARINSYGVTQESNETRRGSYLGLQYPGLGGGAAFFIGVALDEPDQPFVIEKVG